MSLKSDIKKAYEKRLIQKALARLERRFNLDDSPLSEDELYLLVKRAREYHRAYGSESKRARLSKYKDYLSKQYGDSCVGNLWETLESINNEIGYEEK